MATFRLSQTAPESEGLESFKLKKKQSFNAGRNIMVTIVKYREDGLVDWAFELLTEEAYENYKPPKGYVIKDIKKLYFKDQVKHI